MMCALPKYLERMRRQAAAACACLLHDPDAGRRGDDQRHDGAERERDTGAELGGEGLHGLSPLSVGSWTTPRRRRIAAQYRRALRKWTNQGWRQPAATGATWAARTASVLSAMTVIVRIRFIVFLLS